MRAVPSPELSAMRGKLKDETAVSECYIASPCCQNAWALGIESASYNLRRVTLQQTDVCGGDLASDGATDICDFH